MISTPRFARLLLILGAVALWSCDGGATDGPSSSGVNQDAGGDAAFDVGGQDGAGADGSAAGADGGAEAGADAGAETQAEVQGDTQADAEQDAGADAESDAAVDSESDAATSSDTGSSDTGSTDIGDDAGDAASSGGADSAQQPADAAESPDVQDAGAPADTGESADVADVADSSGASDSYMGPTSCTANKNFCWDNNVWYCNSSGKPTGVKTLCGALLCQLQGGAAVCAGAAPDVVADSAEGPDAGGAVDASDVADVADIADVPDVADVPDIADIKDTADVPDGDGYVGPTTCDTNKQFCFDNKIWYCSNGKPTTVKTTCGAGYTCQIASGVAACVLAPDVAADTADVADIADTADISDVPDIADIKDTADVPDGDGYVGPTSCDTNKQFCVDNKIWYCSNGKPTTVKTICGAGYTCQVVGGVPACALQSDTSGDTVADIKPDTSADAGADTLSDTLSDSVADTAASCTANVAFCSGGNVWGCSAMGKPTAMISDCASFAWSCQVVNAVAKCVAPVDASGDTDAGPAKTCTPNKTFCDGGVIRYCNANGTWGSVKTTCGSGQVCGIQGGAPVCILGSYACVGDQCTCTPAEPDSCTKVTKAGTSLGYVYGVSKRTSCYTEPSLSECAEFNSCQSGQCTSSVSNAASPYWNYSCDMPQFLSYKTALPVDCRCLTHQALESGLLPCKRPYELKNAGATIGSGPRFATLQQVAVQGGFVDAKTDEIVTAVAWSGSTDRKGLIVAVEVKTGNRRVISGQYQENGAPATKGSGPNLQWPLDVQAGPGGKLLAINDVGTAAPEILAIDPLTGNRTLLWRGGDAAFGQCASADAGKFIQTNALGFAVDGDGSMIIGYSNALIDGRGIARISADGKTCKIISGSGSKNGAIDKGTGNALGGFVQGFAIQAGQLWALTTQPKALWSIDLATGNRTQVYTAASATVMGERRLGWDAARKLWWISGVQNSTTISAFDPVTKVLSNVDTSCGADKLFKLCWAGPININTLNYGGLYVHPSNSRMYFGHDLMSLVEVEPEMGNSLVLSL